MQTLTVIEQRKAELQHQVEVDCCATVSKEDLAFIVANIPFEVCRDATKYGFNEAYLGMGYIYSCTDYGKMWDLPDEEIIRLVKENIANKWSQYTHFAVVTKTEKDPKYNHLLKKTRQFCDKVVIFVSSMGYAPKAMLFNMPPPPKPIPRFSLADWKKKNAKN